MPPWLNEGVHGGRGGTCNRRAFTTETVGPLACVHAYLNPNVNCFWKTSKAPVDINVIGLSVREITCDGLRTTADADKGWVGGGSDRRFRIITRDGQNIYLFAVYLALLPSYARHVHLRVYGVP